MLCGARLRCRVAREVIGVRPLQGGQTGLGIPGSHSRCAATMLSTSMRVRTPQLRSSSGEFPSRISVDERDQLAALGVDVGAEDWVGIGKDGIT